MAHQPKKLTVWQLEDIGDWYTRADASKIALAALVCLCRRQGVQLIDCQQNTRHLASLGAREMARAAFVAHVQQAQRHAPLQWNFEPLYWNALLSSPCTLA